MNRLWYINLQGVIYPRLPFPEYTSLGYRRYSTAFICPWCLERWASLSPEDADVGQFCLQPTACDACARTFDACRRVPGSLLDSDHQNGVDYDLLETLPDDLVRREYDLHFRSLANEQPTANPSPPPGSGS